MCSSPCIYHFVSVRCLEETVIDLYLNRRFAEWMILMVNARLQNLLCISTGDTDLGATWFLSCTVPLWFMLLFICVWWHGNAFNTTDLCEGNPPVTTSHWGFPSQRTSNEEGALVFYLSQVAVKQTVKFPVMWHIMTLMQHHCNVHMQLDVCFTLYF